MLRITYSNRIEELFARFENSTLKNLSPFAQRLLVAPSPPMKTWLKEQLALSPKIGSSLGYKILTVEEALSTLKRLFCPASLNLDTAAQDGKVIQDFELESLTTGGEHSQMVKAPSAVGDYGSKGYVNLPSSTAVSRLKRIPHKIELTCAIEGRLAQLEEPKLDWAANSDRRKFYLADQLATLFQKYGRFLPEGLAGWQKTLWDQIFNPEGPWTFPYAYFSGPIDTSSIESTALEIDIFGLTFLSKLEFNFLHELSRHVEVRFWLLSPCLHFWTDLATDREKKWLLRCAPLSSLEKLDELLSDTNPLLANFGKLGREMAKMLDDYPSETAYVVSEETLLEEMDPCDEETRYVSEPATVLRYLQSDLLFLRNPQITAPHVIEDDSLEMHQLPNLLREIEWVHDLVLRLLHNATRQILILAPDIEPYVPLIERVFAKLPLSILSQKTLKESPLSLLLDYYLSHKKANHLCTLLPAAGFEAEEERKIRSWIKAYDLPTEGIEPLLLDFMKGSLELSSLELVAKWEDFSRRLHQNTPEGTKNLKEWTDWLEKGVIQASEEISYALHKMGDKVPEPITYYSFVQHVKRLLLEQQEAQQEPNLGQIRFASLLPMRTQPAEALILIGMQEGAFPRKNSINSLELPCKDWSPSKSDYDRALFLECLLSARKHLFITWSGAIPSQLVQEALDYLKIAFKPEKSFYEHPETAWDPIYFSLNSPLRSFSEKAWRALHVKPQKNPTSLKFMGPPPSFEEEPIGLRELEQVIKNPIEYFHKHLGIRKPNEERDFEQEATLDLNALEQWQIRKDVLEKKNSSMIKGSSLFEKVRRKKEEQKRGDIQDYLASEGITQVLSEKVVPTKELPIHGIIPYTTPEGIVFLGERKKWIQALPHFLLATHQNPQRTKIYCLKDKKTLSLSLEPLAILQKWVSYAAKAKRSLYPFVPEWIESILKGDSKTLSEHLKSSGLSQSADEIIQAYQKEAQDLFGTLF